MSSSGALAIRPLQSQDLPVGCQVDASIDGTGTAGRGGQRSFDLAAACDPAATLAGGMSIAKSIAPVAAPKPMKSTRSLNFRAAKASTPDRMDSASETPLRCTFRYGVAHTAFSQMAGGAKIANHSTTAQ
jgi:hypothetical protein